MTFNLDMQGSVLQSDVERIRRDSLDLYSYRIWKPSYPRLQTGAENYVRVIEHFARKSVHAYGHCVRVTQSSLRPAPGSQRIPAHRSALELGIEAV
jgi:hypothetical protein